MPADQLELRVEVELDAGQRLEPVPRPPPHLGHRVRVPARRRPGRAAGAAARSGGGTEVANPSSPAAAPPVPAARSAAGDPLCGRRVHRGHHVVRGQPGAVGQHHLHPRPQVRRLLAVGGRRFEVVDRGPDEPDAEREQMPVPVVEPRLRGGAVEHPVGLAVVPVHLQLQLQEGGEVGAGVAPARVEGGQHLGHVEDQRLELRRVDEPAGSRWRPCRRRSRRPRGSAARPRGAAGW